MLIAAFMTLTSSTASYHCFIYNCQKTLIIIVERRRTCAEKYFMSVAIFGIPSSMFTEVTHLSNQDHYY